MANTPYSNFYLSNEIEDQYKSHLDLTRFCTIDNNLQGTPGMIRKIHVYSADDNKTEKLTKGNGNSYTIEAGYAEVDYTIALAQNRFSYYEEEEMTDPLIVTTGVKQLGTDLFNLINSETLAEFNKAQMLLIAANIGFDAFVDAVSMLQHENLEGAELFAFVCPQDMAKVRKACASSLQYNESFARAGYVGTIAGVNLYISKIVTSGSIVIADKEAVTLFNKTGVEVEQGRVENTRQNTIYSRKYYLAAMTNAKHLVKIGIGLTATACPSTETSVDSSKTYYAKQGAGYVKVIPAAGDNPYSKGWYTVA